MKNNQNILFLFVDQWPAWAFSRRGETFPTLATDALAAEGTEFLNAFTSCPLCTPARASLLTARWACQNGVYDNYSTGYSQQKPLSFDKPTWMDEAVRRGYHVGYYGKWHVGTDGPILRGAHRCDKKYDSKNPYDPAISDFSYEKTKKFYTTGMDERFSEGRAGFWGTLKDPDENKIAPFREANKGVAFIDEYAKGCIDKPFFLTVSMGPPHFPHYLPPKYAALAKSLSVKLPASIRDRFDNKPPFQAKPWWPVMDTSVLNDEEWKTVIQFSQAHISMTDDAVGRVINALKKNNLYDNTAIVFIADHGDMQGSHNRFDKGPYFYEEVWRIPLIVRIPGVQPAKHKTFVSILDTGETLFRLIGADTASKPRAGRNLLSLVGLSGSPDGWENIAYGAYDLYNGMSFAVRAIRDERYKYIWNPQTVDELYDLKDDPAELTNRIGDPAFAAVNKVLREKLLRWMESVGDDLPSRTQKLPEAGTILATGRMGP
ncbi:MAG TPA: hypothetical protein DC049_05855 [Spirochaetia bacterium]|nr:hypothetical protein [Spirochaetia bacterium]